jgi:hypothetical protein
MSDKTGRIIDATVTIGDLLLFPNSPDRYEVTDYTLAGNGTPAVQITGPRCEDGRWQSLTELRDAGAYYADPPCGHCGTQDGHSTDCPEGSVCPTCGAFPCYCNPPRVERTEPGSRVLRFTNLDLGEYGKLTELLVEVNYAGTEPKLHQALTLDNTVIPLILDAINGRHDT